jgi:phosphatidylglycerol---prolipoprotein diacylglyceryl transferase
MHPEICRIGLFTVYSYGLMLVLAFTVSTFLASRHAVKIGRNPEHISNLCFIALVAGIVGARIFYVVSNFSLFLHNPVEIVMLSRGGLSWFGGLLLGTGSAFVYLKRKKMPVFETLDLIAPFVALAHSIGRIGCLLNGCCFGRHSAFGLYFPSHEAVLIPTQLYSSLCLLGIYIILRFLQERPHQIGVIFYLYLALYSAKRFGIEFMRADSDLIFMGLTMFQLISVVIFCISIGGLYFLKNKPRA